MNPTQPTDPNQPQVQPQPTDLPQAPMSADLPPTPTPPDPAPIATPPPTWDAQPPQPAPPVDVPATPTEVPPAAAQPWNEAATPPAEPVTPPDQPPAPIPEAPPVNQAPPQVSSDWSQPVAPAPAAAPEPVSWESQAQTPPADPAVAPDAPDVPVAPMGMPSESGQPAPVDVSMPQPEARVSQEAAPTDLSSLAAALGAPSITGANGVQSEAPVEQSVNAPTQPPQTPAASDTPTVVTGSHGIHLSKWVIVAVAVVGLLAVVGSSAYFILGVGQTPEPSTSLPAEQQNLTNPPRSIIPTPTPVVSSEGTSLGSISGASPSAQASSSGTLAPGATSVFDRRATQ